MAAPYRLFMKILLIIFFISPVITIALSSGRADGADGGNLPLAHKTRARKVLEVNALLDYDDVCANPRHDPRRKPGCNKLNP